LFGIEAPPEQAPKHFEVIPAAWPAVRMFIKVQTQWRAGFGALVGLDYNVLRWLFELEQVDDPRELLEDIQVIEAKVVEIMNKQKG
jgi:hypothetical protein